MKYIRLILRWLMLPPFIIFLFLPLSIFVIVDSIMWPLGGQFDVSRDMMYYMKDLTEMLFKVEI